MYSTLKLNHLGILPTICDELSMSSVFSDVTVVQYDNLISFFYGLETMGDNDECPSFTQSIERLRNFRFRKRIKCGSGLIQYNDFGILEEESSNRETLAFTTRKPDTLFSNLRLKPFGHTPHEFALGCFKRGMDFLLSCHFPIRKPVREIFVYCPVKYGGLLRKVSDVSVVRFERDGTEILSVGKYRSGRRSNKPKKKFYDRRFSCAGFSNEGYFLSSTNQERKILQNWLTVLIGERDVFESDFSRSKGKIASRIIPLDRRNCIECINKSPNVGGFAGNILIPLHDGKCVLAQESCYEKYSREISNGRSSRHLDCHDSKCYYATEVDDELREIIHPYEILVDFESEIFPFCEKRFHPCNLTLDFPVLHYGEFFHDDTDCSGKNIRLCFVTSHS